MPLYQFTIHNEGRNNSVNPEELSSLIYHDIFDYPLTRVELAKWKTGKKFSILNSQFSFGIKDNFYFIEGREEIIYKRLLRAKVSERKLNLARKFVKVLGLIPTIKMVGITGALAMGSADSESDIDLMLITKKGALWTTRLISLFLLDLFGIPRRRYGDKNQKDKLCLNIWLDEGDLAWARNDRNVYTAHEIAQVIPLLNKNKTYERFIWKNRWARGWWPNATVKSNKQHVTSGMVGKEIFPILRIFEPLARFIQYQHMKNRITREVVTSTRALFHPVDWGKVVLARFSS